jgi:secreted trypsin-like serine protease
VVVQLIKRWSIWIGAAVAGLALTAMPAAAIIGGTQDTGNTYSNVGLIITNTGSHFCSGTLFHKSGQSGPSNLFMTAAHCVLGYQSYLVGGKVTFDPLGDTNPSYQSVNIVSATPIPGYQNGGSSNSFQAADFPDVAVLVLDHAPAGITPADLPTAGQFDNLDLKSATLTAVGYGTTTATSQTYVYGARYYKTTGITPGQRMSYGNTYLKADSSTCFGDSGGPNFYDGTSTIMGVTSWGQSIVCSDHNYIYRLDNAEALGFLNSF